jgi:arylsulfatase A
MRLALPPTLLLLALVATTSGADDPDRRADRPPNVVLIMADDVGYECFGSYGSKQYETPHLDRMAANGIRFEHCYSQPLCTPSRVKLMTGLSNVRNYSAFSVLNRDQTTFADYLRDAGYRTAAAGKWQLYGAEHYDARFRAKGTLPGDAGFDRWCLWQVDELGERYWGPLMNVDGENRQYPADAYGPDVAADFLADFMAEKSDKPFFAYYPMILVHGPFPRTPHVPAGEKHTKQQSFEAMVAYVDHLVGRLVARTEELGIAENTLFLFTTDNGTGKGLNSRLGDVTIAGGKGQTTDAGTRAAMIGYWPGTIAPGRVSSDLVDFSDFTPTLLHVAGASPTPKVPFDGRSFLPQLLGKPGMPREWIHLYYCPRPERTKPVRFVRDQRWKLYGDGRFYDVAADPLERKPFATPPDDAALRAHAELSAALATFPAEGQTLLRFAP